MSTYGDIRKQRCEWCATEKPRREIGDRNSVRLMHQVLYCPDPENRGPVSDWIPCTAPTPEQVVEDQGREIATLKVKLDAEEAETVRLMELFALVPHAPICAATRLRFPRPCSCFKSKVLS